MMKSLIYIGELKRFKPRTEVVYTVNEGRSKRTCIYNQNSREMTRAWTIEFKAYIAWTWNSKYENVALRSPDSQVYTERRSTL